MITINPQSHAQRKRITPRLYERTAPKVGIGEPTIPVDIPRNQVLLGDATQQLRRLPENSVDCVITSPPYFLLRDYNADGQIGLEATIDDWVEEMRSVFSEVARVLKPAGGLWLNIGDTFSGHAKVGALPKSMLLAPERLLLALSKDGWIVRSKVIWSKTNTMPNCVADRLNVTYEPIYHLVRSPRYYFDLDAIREPITPSEKHLANALPANDGTLLEDAMSDATRPILGTNPGDVWRIATKGFRGQHFATFPEGLITKPLLSSVPEKICTTCGTPWKRALRTWRVPLGDGTNRPNNDPYVMRFGKLWNTLRQSGDLVPCGCGAPTVPGIVLDPFFGAGTTGVVAKAHGRDWLGIEINEDYRDLSLHRLASARGGK